jgi:hypothetical protein
MDKITKQKLDRYFQVTETALEIAKKSRNRTQLIQQREDMIDMVERYLSDARHFDEKGDLVNAFAALNYAHGWLDAGARLGIFDVHDNKYFTVD